MYICLCRNIKCSDIIREVGKRPSVPPHENTEVSLEFAEEIHLKCSNGAGLGCGLCLDSVKDVIDEHLSVSKKSPAKIRKQA